MTELLSSAFGAALVAGIFGVYQRNRDRKDDTREALRMMFYKSIKQSAKEYIERGSITSEELEDLIEEHRIYHDTLKGNGFLDQRMKQVRALPVQD